MKPRFGITAQTLSACVRAYQLTLRPVIGAHCRFEPSCSHYAIAALASHGAWRGSVLSVRRVLRCNPWHPGGEDPVPQVPAPIPPLSRSGWPQGRRQGRMAP